MLENCYKFDRSSDFKTFEFISKGPKGEIVKVVKYSKYDDGDLWNLGFGDKDLATGDLSDLSISDNGDRTKILTTVASTLTEFIENYPNAQVMAIGSNEVRNRLYRMGISNNLEMIEKDFEIQGLKDNNWESFSKNIKYDAFLLKKKIVNL